MIPVKVEQLVAAVGGELLTGSGSQLINEVIIDSREKAEDGLFVPIIGEKTDSEDHSCWNISPKTIRELDGIFEEILKKYET